MQKIMNGTLQASCENLHGHIMYGLQRGLMGMNCISYIFNQGMKSKRGSSQIRDEVNRDHFLVMILNGIFLPAML